MSTNKKDILCWMEKAELDKLNANIKSNLDRYKSGNFDDLAAQPSWTKTHLLSYDASKFKGLSGKSANENAEMLIIYSELKELKPRLARCLNTWVGLTHTHLLKYGRERWLEPYFSDEEELINRIRKHFFAGGRTGVRDDNTAGRLWWTAYIGHRIASGDSKKIGEVMKPLMRTTDTRLTSIERPGIFTETGFAKSISDYLEQGRHPEAAKAEQPYRNFIRTINLRSNGRYFGDMSNDQIFEFLDSCK